MLEKIFKLSANKTDAKTEVLAGITTFMTMAYILAVNPNILSATGMGRRAAFFWSRFWGCWSWHFWCSVRDFHSGGIIRLRWQRKTESISLRLRQKWCLWSSCYPLEYVLMPGSAGIWERHLCGRCGYWSQGFSWHWSWGSGGYIRLVKKLAWMRMINREAVVFVII